MYTNNHPCVTLFLQCWSELWPSGQYQLDFANYISRSEKIATEGLQKHFNKLVLEEFFQMKNKLCTEEVVNILWQGVELNPPCHYLQPYLSPVGHCYSFNMMPHAQFYKQNVSMMASSYLSFKNDKGGIKENLWSNRLNDTPWNSKDNSFEGGVRFILNFRSHDYTNFNFGDKSFTVVVHSPEEMPDGLHSFHSVRVNSLGLINTEPHLYLASPSTKALPPSHRGCYLPQERKLRFFINYNMKNCEVECYVNLTHKECGCMPYYFPKEEEVPICGISAEYNQCIFRLMRSIHGKCNCLPNCHRVSYSSSFLDINSEMPIHNKHDVAIIVVKVSKKGSTAIVSENIADGVKFIGHLGGLLSLFLGASVVSLVEIMYLCSLRPLVVLWNLRRQRRGPSVDNNSI